MERCIDCSFFLCDSLLGTELAGICKNVKTKSQLDLRHDKLYVTLNFGCINFKKRNFQERNKKDVQEISNEARRLLDKAFILIEGLINS